MSKITFLTKERFAANDLIWFFCHSDADTTIKSNFQAMCNAVIYFGSVPNYSEPFNSFILNSIARKRELSNIYFSLPPKTQEVLYASFGDFRYHPSVDKIFNDGKTDLTGAAHCSDLVSFDQLITLCQKLHQGGLTAKETVLLSNIRIETRNNYQKAINEYFAAHKEFYKNKKDR